MIEPEKIAFITTTFSNITNGPTKFVRLLHDYALNNEELIIFFTEEIENSIKQVEKVNIPKIVKLPGLGLFYRILKYFFIVMKDKEVKVVVANNTMYLFLFYFFSKKKTIGFINDDEHFFAKKRGAYKSIRSLVFNLMEKMALRRNNITVVNSGYLKNRIKSFSKDKDSIKILYKGIELKGKKPYLKKHYDDHIFKIIFVKNNFELGGLKTLLESLKTLKNIELSVVTSARVLKSVYEYELLKEMKNVNLFHNLSQDEVFELMFDAHCICIPSVKEALGVANMEGMIHSCMVISTNVGGIPEVLNFGKAGVLVPPKDYLTLRNEIERAHKDRNYRIDMVEEAYNFVKKFSIENTFMNFFTICRN